MEGKGSRSVTIPCWSWSRVPLSAEQEVLNSCTEFVPSAVEMSPLLLLLELCWGLELLGCVSSSPRAPRAGGQGCAVIQIILLWCFIKCL